jgi:hypothetical protein
MSLKPCLLSLFFVGCASSAPMSETLTFYNDKLTEKEPIVDEIHYSFLWNGSKAVVRDRFDAQATSDPRYIETTRSNVKHDAFGLFGWTHIQKDFSMSASMGYPLLLSADFTMRLPFDLYSTNRASLFSGMETILQKPIYKTNWMSLNLGYSYRTDSHLYQYSYRINEDCQAELCLTTGFANLFENTKIHGPRISMASPYFYMFAHYGAFSNLNRPVFFITLSTSLKY